MNVEAFYDEDTFTLTYVVFDPATRDAVVIDPVLDYDPVSSTTSTRSAGRIEAFLKRESLRLHFVLETHAHADHLSGSQYLKRRFGAKVTIGRGIVEVQKVFVALLDLDASFVPDGRQFDKLLDDGEITRAGFPSVQVNIAAGRLPKARENGHRYLTVPINLKHATEEDGTPL